MLIVAASTVSCASVRLQGQSASMCHPDTADYGGTKLDWVTEIVTSADSVNTRLRAAYNLPAVAASEVRIVTDPAACAQAAQVIAAQVPREQQYPVWLIRAGPERYVVTDGVPLPAGPVHKYLATLVLDRNFAVLETVVHNY